MTVDLNRSPNWGNNQVSTSDHKGSFVQISNVVALTFLIHFESLKVKRIINGLSYGHRSVSVTRSETWAHLVVLWGRHHEEDGRDPVKALKPLLPLGPLPADIHHLERNLLDDKVMLHNAFSCLPGKQNVLPAWDIVLKIKNPKQTFRFER